MGTIYDSEKLKFYSELRNNEFVHSLNAEERIKELTEKILVYVYHAELAIIDNPDYRKQEQNIERRYATIRLNKGRSILVDVEAGLLYKKPTLPEFQDIKEIAYEQGIYKDNRGLIDRVLRKEHALDQRLNRHIKGYELFKNKRILSNDNFEDYVNLFIFTNLNLDLKKELSIDPLKEVSSKCCDYLNRDIKLLRLASLPETIFQYYDNKLSHYKEKGVKNADWQGYISFKNEKMSDKDIRRIAECFEKQAKIDSLLFKTIFLALLRKTGISKPEGYTEEFYNHVTSQYWRISSVNFNVIDAKK